MPVKEAPSTPIQVDQNNLTLPGGRRIERLTRRCEATGDVYHVFYVRDDAGTQSLGLTSSPGQRFSEFHAANGNVTEIDPRPSDPMRDEIEAFAALGFPGLAKTLAAKIPPRAEPFPGALFAPGPIGFSANLIATGTTQADVLEYVRRHVAGDHGEYGSSAGIEPTDAEMFCPAESPVATKNAVAIKQGRGLVVSRYPLWKPGISEHAFQVWAKSHHPNMEFPLRRDDRLTVVTLLAGAKTATATSEGRKGTGIAF